MSMLLLILIFMILLIVFPQAVEAIVEGTIIITFAVIVFLTAAILAIGIAVVV